MIRKSGFSRPDQFVAVAVLLSMSALAAAGGITNHEPASYKMTKFGETGERIPLNGPVIHVFSTDGKKYTSIANDNEKLTHASRVGGICDKRLQKFKSGSVTVAGQSHSVSGKGEHVMKTHTEAFDFPFTLPDISRSPAAACNHELDKRVASGNKSRAHWFKRGFVVKYENAYEAKFEASCSGGLGKGEFKSKTIRTPVWIACAATEAASDPKPDSKPKPARKPKPEPSRARPVPLKVTAKLEADNPGTIYSKKCPVRVKYSGSIYVSKPNTEVTYQIAGSDWDSPERTITIAKPGFQEITSWTQYYREKETDTGSFASSSEKTPDSKGTVRLTVKAGGKTVRSKQIAYQVFCNSEKPMRLKTN